jgi:hypothetical protein
MKISVYLERIFIGMALMLILFLGAAHAETASVYGRDIDLTPAAARAIGLGGTGHVTVSRL